MNLTILSLVILCYLAVLTHLAFKGYRQTQDSNDYLVAGRSINPGVMALSYGATFISTSAIVGFGGAAGVFGFSLLWLTFLNIFLGIFIAFAFFGVRIRRLSIELDTSTLPSLLGARFDSKFITIFTGAMVFLFMPAYTSIILVGGARFVQEALGMDYNLALFVLAVIVGAYVVSGGLKAVMYTDAFSAAIMLFGMIYLLFSAYGAVGGILSAHQELTELAHLVPAGLQSGGHRGWTAMPEAFSPIWWTVFSTIVLGVGVGVLAQPQLAVRFMTVKQTKSLYRAILVGGIFIFFMTGTAFMVGPLSNLFFYQTEGLIALEAAAGNSDLIIPMFINNIMPEWFLYLFTLTLISAAISTLSSLIHVQGSAFSRDILSTAGVQLPNGNDNKAMGPVVLARIGVIIGTVAAVLLAYVLPGSIIARATAFWFGICAAGLLPTLIATLYWPNATRAGAIASIIVGYGVSIFGFVFLHLSESQPLGISRLLFGRDALLEFPWTHIDPLIYALPAGGITLIVVSLLTRQHATVPKLVKQ